MDERIAQNRKAWNETAAIHERAKLPELLDAIARGGFSTLDPTEERVFAEIGIAGRDVAQLCCNNARELLSLKLGGAGRSVGFDISGRFIEQGTRLARAAGVELELVTTDVFAIGAEYDHSFDLVYITVGALGWMPDLDAFFAVASRLLRPGGTLFIYEMHPLLDMFDTDKGMVPEWSYFRTEPFFAGGEPDYFDPSAVVEEPSYWFHHRLADVIGAVLRNRMTLTTFDEHPHDISNAFESFAPAAMLPLCYTLTARRAVS